jgi:hypothetical protein
VAHPYGFNPCGFDADHAVDSAQKTAGQTGLIFFFFFFAVEHVQEYQYQSDERCCHHDVHE